MDTGRETDLEVASTQVALLRREGERSSSSFPSSFLSCEWGGANQTRVCSEWRRVSLNRLRYRKEVNSRDLEEGWEQTWTGWSRERTAEIVPAGTGLAPLLGMKETAVRARSLLRRKVLDLKWLDLGLFQLYYDAKQYAFSRNSTLKFWFFSSVSCGMILSGDAGQQQCDVSVMQSWGYQQVFYSVLCCQRCFTSMLQTFFRPCAGFQLCSLTLGTHTTIFFTFRIVFNKLHEIFHTLLWNKLCVRYICPSVG